MVGSVHLVALYAVRYNQMSIPKMRWRRRCETRLLLEMLLERLLRRLVEMLVGRLLERLLELEMLVKRVLERLLGWLLSRFSQMLLLLIRSHILLLTQMLQLIRLSPLCTLTEDSLEEPLNGRCLLSMQTMWRYNYGRTVPH